MRESAVVQAELRLDRAHRAAKELKAAKSYEEAEAAWCDFLISANTVYSKLEQGAKGIPATAQWFAQKKGERRKDPLLKYLHFARNSDEHGIDLIVARVANNITLAYNEVHVAKVAQVDPNTKQPIEPFREAYLYGPYIAPVIAHDRRFNTTCDPPTEHMGKTIPEYTRADKLPDVVLPYLEALVEEARKLI